MQLLAVAVKIDGKRDNRGAVRVMLHVLRPAVARKLDWRRKISRSRTIAATPCRLSSMCFEKHV